MVSSSNKVVSGINVAGLDVEAEGRVDEYMVNGVGVDAFVLGVVPSASAWVVTVYDGKLFEFAGSQ